MTMLEWLKGLPKAKKALPLLSFPSVALTGESVHTVTHDAIKQAEGVKAIADALPLAAAVTMMDLSLEAEAFGATLDETEGEVPTVLGEVIFSEEDGLEGAEALRVPSVGEGRTALYIEAATLAKSYINDRPTLAGIIGPYSLAGRLMGVTEALMNCLCEEEFTHTVLRKTTDFLKAYALAYKQAGLDGIVMAEPLAGLLSPELEREFSAPYVKEIVDAVQDENFIVIYHNCGPNIADMTESLAEIGAAAYHFGDAVDLLTMLEKMPRDRIVMGNISPSDEFVNGTPESMTKAVRALVSRASVYDNFVLSSGCDIPPHAKWENIRAFVNALLEA